MLKIHKHAIHIWSCCFIAWIASRASSLIAWIASRACNFIAWIGSISATFLCIIQNMFLHFFMKFSLAFRPSSTSFGSLSFVTFCDVLFIFILGYKEKELKQTWIQFLNILFLIQPGKVWNVLWGNLKNHRNPLKPRCILVWNVRAIRYFPSQNRSDLLMRE